MTGKEFIEKVQNVSEGSGYYNELDELCIQWLKNMADDFGRDGQTAKALLEIVKELLVI